MTVIVPIPSDVPIDCCIPGSELNAPACSPERRPLVLTTQMESAIPQSIFWLSDQTVLSPSLWLLPSLSCQYLSFLATRCFCAPVSCDQCHVTHNHTHVQPVRHPYIHSLSYMCKRPISTNLQSINIHHPFIVEITALLKFAFLSPIVPCRSSLSTADSLSIFYLCGASIFQLVSTFQKRAAFPCVGFFWLFPPPQPGGCPPSPPHCCQAAASLCTGGAPLVKLMPRAQCRWESWDLVFGTDCPGAEAGLGDELKTEGQTPPPHETSL